MPPCRQISDAQQGQPRLVPGAIDSPEDFTVTVEARSAVADGPWDLKMIKPLQNRCENWCMYVFTKCPKFPERVI
ncbi:hypothetical protein WISP_78141 [Willisornis vidua]|uniref:Uncharacterized protein n=1 Tax=Willisornis vidua TaxID=1566151 RepID=A0ABQ9D5S7_9PASS|nr:hypothetical protein WISP_78141 [Willisornis vidua]